MVACTGNRQQLNKKCFPGMRDKGTWIGVAFQRGVFSDWYHDLIMIGTLGSYVHCELLLGDGMYADAFASYYDTNLSEGFMRSKEYYDPREWVVLSYPVSDLIKAHALCVFLLDAKIPYNTRDLWQCCVGLALPFEQEIDCTQPSHWKKGVFCSQMCLLFMRYMHLQNNIKINSVCEHHLKHIHSRGCSPNSLYAFLSHFCNKIDI